MKRRKSYTSQIAAANLARWMLENGTPEMWARMLTDPIPPVTLGALLRGHVGTAVFRSRKWLIGQYRRARWLLASPRRGERLAQRDLDRFLSNYPQCAPAVDPGSG
ncbi:hypothetical protein [Kitasatospora sp. NPDC088779]|uniref:hypothetical protein n=1 Tax=Kitasatospora sp. NPDC088779 TaxID=3154964 RepID=UPI00341B4C06